MQKFKYKAMRADGSSFAAEMTANNNANIFICLAK